MTMSIMRFVVIACVLIMGPSGGTAFDLHEFWDSRCHDCHGHAGAFARAHLKADNGVLTGRHQRRDLKRFLGQHEMGPAHVDGIYAMLLAQAVTPPLFQRKCSCCHKPAAEFARRSVVQKDDTLLGRSNQIPLSDFLQRHGGLRTDEVAVVVDSPTRIFNEVQQSTTK
jgi:hypothetical protein